MTGDQKWGTMLVFDLDADDGVLEDIAAWCREQGVAVMVCVVCLAGPHGPASANVFVEAGRETEAAMLSFWPQCRSAARLA